MNALAARVLALVIALAAAGAGSLALAPAAGAAACSGSTGVTVVVDFASSDGGIITRCASGDPRSGLEALSKAGFAVKVVSGQPFVCTIDAKPSSASCGRIPPASAYWAYWHAQPGGSWSYSSTGAGGYDPAPGSVEGWSFGSGAPPGSAPPAASAPKPSTSSTSSPPSTTTPSTSRSTPSSTTTSSSSAAKPGRTTAGATSNPSATLTARTARPAASTATASPSPSVRTPAAAQPTSQTAMSNVVAVADPPSSGQGGITSLVGGLALVAVLTGVAGALAWRRRHETGDVR